MEKTKITDGVFIDVLEKLPHFNNGKSHHFDLAYEDIVDEIKSKVYQLGLLEEIMIQKRCSLNVIMNPMTEIKLSFVRNYVYAITPFLRRFNTFKDIRVLVKRTSIIYADNPTPTLEQLYQDHMFMMEAKDKLFEAMNVVLQKNILMYDIAFGKHFLPL